MSVYKSQDELLDQILDILEGADEPMSATAISKELGYSKLRSRVSEAIGKLTSDGDIVATASKAGYNVYTVADAEEDEEEEVEAVAPREITEITLPTNLNGYDIEVLDKGHTKVIFPGEEGDDENSVVLEPNERLLVINQNEEYRFVVSTPEQLLEAIGIYTQEQGIATYLVTDTATGNAVSDTTEIDMKVAIIFLEISRHDKAGA